MKTTATTEEVSSPPEEKWHWSQQWRQNTFRAGQKPKADWKKDLHNLGAGRKSRKPPTPFVGMKSYGKCQLNAEHRMLGDSIIVRWLEESSDTGSFVSRYGQDLDIGPFPWEEALGRWAVTLKASGLMEERVRQRLQQHSRPHEEEQPISTSVTTTITFCSGCARLYDLLLRSLGPETAAA